MMNLTGVQCMYTSSCIKSYSDFMNFPVSNHCDHHHHHHRHHLQQMHMINESMSIVLSGLKVSSGFTSNQPTMVMRSLHGLFAANPWQTHIAGLAQYCKPWFVSIEGTLKNAHCVQWIHTLHGTPRQHYRLTLCLCFFFNLTNSIK